MSIVINMPVSVTTKNDEGNNVRKEIGKVAVTIFSLSDFNLGVDATGKDEDGLDVYEDKKHQHVYDALVSTTKAAARNLLIDKTCDIIEGRKIATTVDELIAEVVRTGGGGGNSAFQALQKEFIDGFKTYLLGSGKSEKVQQLYASMIAVNMRKTIPQCREPQRLGLLAQLNGYKDEIGDEWANKFSSIFVQLSTLCANQAAIEDDAF